MVDGSGAPAGVRRRARGNSARSAALVVRARADVAAGGLTVSRLTLHAMRAPYADGAAPDARGQSGPPPNRGAHIVRGLRVFVPHTQPCGAGDGYMNLKDKRPGTLAGKKAT